ncbi:MAG: putative bifunctional diguanylate cyclase/phosphodiesterase [Myxococcota bacterium]
MTIQRQLIVILFATVLFAVSALFGLIQVSKGARFHQLNSLHLTDTIALGDLVAESAPDVPPPTVVRALVTQIREQPLECLRLIRPWDEFAMELIGTEQAPILCREDIALANALLADLERYERKDLGVAEMRASLVDATRRFSTHSAEFERPIAQTANLINRVAMTAIPLLAGIALFVTLTVARRISKVVADQSKATLALEASEKENRRLAHYDSLTNLPNRNLFGDRLTRALARAERRGESMGLMFIDLDRFKNVNDTLGHEAGDQLIKIAAKRIQAALRKTDTVARLGGDEFVTIVEGAKQTNDLAVAAHKIVDTLQRPFHIQGVDNYVTASVGVTHFPADGSDADALLKNADIAMYEAKARGKDQFAFYEPALENSARHRQHLESELRQAIEREEFELHYQPVVRLANLQTCGFESLLRWTNRENEKISPARFIPIAEESGLIIEIGEWVLAQAVSEAVRWNPDPKNPVQVAVNVSGVQLLAPGFTNSVEGILSRSGIDRRRVELEITESQMLTEDPRCIRTLCELSEIGVRLLMDDFGTGYSCLANLHQLPFDVLKIDNSFLRNRSNNPIAAAVIGMANALKMDVIAEGVETQEVLAFLLDRDCQYAQGYLFGKPGPPDTFDPTESHQQLTPPPSGDRSQADLMLTPECTEDAGRGFNRPEERSSEPVE